MSMKKIKKSLTIYKISLAIADLTCGVLVCPGFIITPHIGRKRVFVLTNGTLGLTETNQHYVDFFGLLTFLPVFVSFGTLVEASAERFFVVKYPMKMKKIKLKRIAVIATTSLWFIGTFLAVLPLIFTDRGYTDSSLVYIFVGNGGYMVLYSCIGATLVISIWIFNVITFVTVRKKEKRIRKIQANRRMLRENELEKRLAKTLGIMVLVFSLCCAPFSVATTGYILYIMKTYRPDSSSVSPFDPLYYTIWSTIFSVVILALASNSIWNYFIYNSLDLSFAKQKNVLKGKVVRPNLSLFAIRSVSNADD